MSMQESTNKFTLNYQQKTNFVSGRLSYCSCLQERKVRTPQSSIAGNTRRSPRRIGLVQQKASTVRL